MNEEEFSQFYEQADDHFNTQSKQPKYPGDHTVPRVYQTQNLCKLQSTALALIEPENNTPVCKALVGSGVSAPSTQKISLIRYQNAAARGYCENIQYYSPTNSAREVMSVFMRLYSQNLPKIGSCACRMIERLPNNSIRSRQTKELAHEFTSPDLSWVRTVSTFDALCAAYRELGIKNCPTDCYCFTVECWRFYEKLFMNGCKLGAEQYKDQLNQMNEVLRDIQEKHPKITEVLQFLVEFTSERGISNSLPLLKFRLSHRESSSLGKREPKTEQKSETPTRDLKACPSSSDLVESLEMGLTTSRSALTPKSSNTEQLFTPEFEEDPQNKLIMNVSDHLEINYS